MTTFNVVYLREYIDPENECETFSAYETIYRNVPNKYYKKFDLRQQLNKVCKYDQLEQILFLKE